MSSTPANEGGQGGQTPSAANAISKGTKGLAEDHRSQPCVRLEPRWGFWATTGLSLAVFAVFIGIQTVVSIVFVIVQISIGGRMASAEDAISLSSTGLLLSLASITSTIPCVALVVLFARLKRGASVRDYLGLRGVPLPVVLPWLGMTLLYVAVVDGLNYYLGGEIVPKFMASAFESAVFLPLLLLALFVMAPVFEEVFFRGFMLEGFRYSRLGATGAVLLISLAWSAIHIQYTPLQIGSIFLGGLLLGVARLRTGSVLVTMAMHSLQNVIATVEAAIYVCSQGT